MANDSGSLRHFTHQLICVDREVRYVIRSYRELSDLEHGEAIVSFQRSALRAAVRLPDYPHVTHDVIIEIPPEWKFPKY